MNLFVPDQAFFELDDRSGTADTFGLELLLDLGGCDLERLDDPQRIRGYLSEIVGRIGMTAYGDPLVVRFGKGALAGWTGIQLITTSSVGLHAVPARRQLYVNIFSCRTFSATAAKDFSLEYFLAQTHRTTTVQRRAPQLEEHR